jgi:hypothetical protein
MKDKRTEGIGKFSLNTVGKRGELKCECGSADVSQGEKRKRSDDYLTRKLSEPSE